MNLFRNATLRQKQTRIMMTSVTVALLLAAAGYISSEVFRFRSELVRFLHRRCQVIGGVCTAALDFNDAKTAAETLSSLARDPHFIGAVLYDKTGAVFATNQNPQQPPHHAPGRLTADVALSHPHSLGVARRILHKDSGEFLGTLYMESDLQALHTRLREQLLIGGVVLLAALGAAWFLAGRLQRVVVQPILELLATARSVAASRDYTKRATRQSNDELGQLVDGFNDMLQQVQNRDAELQLAQNFLEQRVEDRTNELQAEVAERRQSEVAVMESQRFLQSTLDALSAHIAILDESGVIISVNAVWNRFAQSNCQSAARFGVGVNYLEVSDHSQGECAEEAPAVARGIRAVLAGEREEFSLEYPCHSPAEKRWFIVRVTRFSGEGTRRIVVAHENITERKQADEERSRLVEFLEASSNEVYVFGSETLRFSYVNASARKNLGYTLEQMAKFTPVDLKPEFTEESFRRTVGPLLEGKAAKHVFQTMHRRADGTNYPVEICLQLVSNSSERVFLAVVNDITERKKTEAELEKAHRKLLEVSRMAGMAEVATGVLHNVGNVLNRVNVSATLLSETVRKSAQPDLARVVALLREQNENLGAFFTNDPRGPKVPLFLAQLADKFARQQETQLQELDSLVKNIGHIKDIVAMQQSYARVSGVTETLPVTDLVEDTLRMNAGSFQRHELEVVREFSPDLPAITTDKHKVLQILVNLVRNAKHACDASGRTDKRVAVRVTHGDGRVKIQVSDNGVGIAPENLNRVFNHGFTTKKDGHGFGLHSGANAARELGGSLTVHSDGTGCGATFTLELPVQPAGPASAASARLSNAA